MREPFLSAAQLKRLQTLWGLYWKKITAGQPRLEGDAGASREARIGWLCGVAGRAIASAKDLTSEEARHAIDHLQKSPLLEGLVTKRRRPDRAAAHAAGTAGRRNNAGGKEIILPAAEHWAKLDAVLRSLGWDQARLAAFLRAPSSPLRGRAKIYTLADLNRVLWALEGIERRAKRQLATESPRHGEIPQEVGHG